MAARYRAPAAPYPDVPDPFTLQVLRDMANRMRIHFIKATCALSFGHPTSCSSAAEIMSVLLFHVMRYKQMDPNNPNNDRFILYKRLPFTDVSNRWLGQELGSACGMAYTGKYFDKASYRIFCLLGDNESSEGCVWEALAFASLYNLDNLVAIFDVNRLGNSGSLPLEDCIPIYEKRCKAFGWNTYTVDGNDVEALCHVFLQASRVKNKPTAIIAKTFKGRGIPTADDAENWHDKPMSKERVDAIIKVIESQIQTTKNLEPKYPIEDAPQINIMHIEMTSPPSYSVGDKVAIQKACGLALVKLGHANGRVILLDNDTRNSTFSDIFKKEHPERFIECSVGRQNMVSVALGCANYDRTIAFASTFAAFLTQAFDQIRLGAMSQSNIKLIGSHCGISIGENSLSQMALEDLAMFRAIPNCTIFYPSDAVSAEHAVFLAASTKGMCYIRTSRPETDVIYSQHEHFKIGQAKVIRQNVKDKVTVIGAGTTLHEILKAAEDLARQGISIRVIDLFTITPLDTATIITNAKATGGHIITVEDHRPEGGIGEAVSAAVSMEPHIRVCQLAVLGVPRNGHLQWRELMDIFGINARHIVMAVKCTLVN